MVRLTKQQTSAPNPAVKLVISDEILLEVFYNLQKHEEDPEQLKKYVLQAVAEERKATLQKTAKKPVRRMKASQQEGYVARRGGANPFRKAEVINDPTLDNNPIYGKLTSTIGVNSILIFIFLQSLVANKISFGSYYASRSANSMIGPQPETLQAQGALSVNLIRNKAEEVRIFWAMWMHSGWFHIGLNVLAQLQYMYMYEPDWGFWRTFLIFFVAGISGNIFSGWANPCGVTVGSSGGLFGLIGANVTYLIEYWHTIPNPIFLMIITAVIVIISFLLGMSKNTDNWAHLGGFLGGLLFSLVTLAVWSVLDTKVEHKRKKKDAREHKAQLHRKRSVKTNRFKLMCKKKCSYMFSAYECGIREWITRVVALALLVTMWVVLFLYILDENMWQTHLPGGMSWGKNVGCCCCDIKIESNEAYIAPVDCADCEIWFYCLPCDFAIDTRIYPKGNGTTFENFCSDPNRFDSTTRRLDSYGHDLMMFSKQGTPLAMSSDSVYLPKRDVYNARMHQLGRYEYMANRTKEEQDMRFYRKRRVELLGVLPSIPTQTSTVPSRQWTVTTSKDDAERSTISGKRMGDFFDPEAVAVSETVGQATMQLRKSYGSVRDFIKAMAALEK